MSWRAQDVEAALQGVSLMRLGAALLAPEMDGQRGPGAALHVACMVLLAVLASAADRANPAWFTEHPLYAFRRCGQAGLAQGLLALPSLATAIAVATRSWWWQHCARLLVASSFQALLWFLWTSRSSIASDSRCSSTGASADSPGAERSAARSTAHPRRRSSGQGAPRALTLTAAAAAAGALLAAASCLLHGAAPPPPDSPRLLLPGSVFELPRDITASAWALQAALLLATAPALDHLAAALPRCFTPGESGILLQALLALAAGSGAYLVCAARQGPAHVLWTPHVARPDPGMHVPAFCMLVLFWILVLAACAAVGLAPPPARGPPGSGSGSGAQQQGARAGGAAADAAGRATVPGGSSSGAGAGAGAPSAAAANGVPHRRLPRPGTSGSAAPTSAPPAARAAGAAAALPPQAPGPPAAPAGLLDRVTRAAAAAGAALSAAMLCDLALWVLGRFVAASSRPRLATLAYWFGCLAGAVPLMVAVSKASAEREAAARRGGAAERQEGGRAGAAAAATSAAEQAAGGEQGQAEARKGAARAVTDAALAGASGDSGDDGPPGCGASSSDAPGSVSTRRCNGDQAARRYRGTPATSAAAGAGAAAAAAADGACPPRKPPAPRRRRLRALGAALGRWLAVPHIVMRKGYHLLAILLFLPAFGWDARMLQASLAVAGAVLVFAEVLRCCGPARARAAIGGFMADFSDARDSGPVYVTHFTLLLGIAVPVWLSDPVCGAAAGAMMAGLYGPDAAVPMHGVHGAHAGGGAAAAAAAAAEGAAAGPAGAPVLSAAAARLLPSCRTVLGLSGLVSLGSGDTAAACVGFLLGQRRLFRGAKKTWEGTASGAAAMMGSWAAVAWWMDVRWALGWRAWGSLGAVTAAVALLEAATAQLDNVVVPLYYLTHLVLTMTSQR